MEETRKDIDLKKKDLEKLTLTIKYKKKTKTGGYRNNGKIIRRVNQ